MAAESRGFSLAFCLELPYKTDRQCKAKRRFEHRHIAARATSSNENARIKISMPLSKYAYEGELVCRGRRRSTPPPEPPMEYPKIKDVLMFGAFVTLGVTILTIVMQGKLPALFNSLPKLRAPSDDEPDAEPEPKLVPAEVLSSEDFAPGYRRYKLATSDAVDLELGQKIVLESGERSVAVAVASKRLQSTVDVVLPTSVREDQGILTETEDLVAIGEELQNGGKIKCGRATEPGLRYKGRELPVSQLIVIAGTAAAIASGCAQVAEVLEDQETSVEKATFIAYCSSAEDYGEALALLEELEAKFPQSVEVRCSWPEEEDDESTPEAKITGELLEWESNSIVVVLGPPLFTSTITNVVTTAKSYPQENVLTE